MTAKTAAATARVELDADSTPYGRALAAIPGYSDIERAIDACKDTVYPDFSVGPDYAEVEAAMRQRARAAVDAGLPIPADVAHELASVGTRSIEAATFARVHRDLTQSLPAEARRLVQTHGDLALAVLAEELDDLIAAVEPLNRDLRGISSAAQAQRLDLTEQWAELTLLADGYEDIRSAQRAVTDAALPEDDQPRRNVFANVCLYRDSLDRMGWWIRRRLDAAYGWQQRNGDPLAHVDWLQAVDPALQDATDDLQSRAAWWPPTGGRNAHLLWLATEGQPWVPDSVAAVRAYDTAMAATSLIARSGRTEVRSNVTRTRGIDFQEQALREHLEVTNADLRRPEPAPVDAQ